MKNPLSEEQIKKINEISRLPVEKQQEELNRFLKTLTPEQLEYLQKQQMRGGECPFCLIAEGGIESYKVYEDDGVVAVLDIKPASEGHVLVIPKQHVQRSTELKDDNVFSAANKIAKRIFDVLGKDTNIFVANGGDAGQRAEHVIVHVIPREKDDGVELGWEGKNIEKKKLEELRNKLYYKEERTEKPEIRELEEDYEEKVRIP
ncbi:MAG TPA: HIT family protein [Candidatus Nanoarchaeia archaeon]|nr:HIT family protein [Candidatus Nanoarchaeia archaeon]